MGILIKKIKQCIGFLRCSADLLWWNIRDFFARPKENAVLFVAHPDDEILFFYTFLKEQHPYVIVLTGCSSFHRLSSLRAAMNKLGLRFRAYPLDTDRATECTIRKIVHKILSRSSYTICATHNNSGEYGHKMHQLVHRVVSDIADCPVYVPASTDVIEKYPLPASTSNEKMEIFNTIYASEDFVPILFKKWIFNEKLKSTKTKAEER